MHARTQLAYEALAMAVAGSSFGLSCQNSVRERCRRFSQWACIALESEHVPPDEITYSTAGAALIAQAPLGSR